MNKLKLKIKGYDEITHSLLVSFASDENLKPIDEYAALAYQPSTMFPDVNDPQEALKKIAVSGIHIANNQKIQENLVNNPATIQAYKDMVGQTFEYNVADIIPAPTQTVPPADQVIDTVTI